jgi:hypothetical protein
MSPLKHALASLTSTFLAAPTRTCFTGPMAGEDLTDEALDQAIDEAGRTWRLEQIKLNEKENELRALRRERDRRRREATQPAFDFNT